MHRLWLVLLIFVVSVNPVHAQDGLVKKLSARSVQETMDNLERLARKKGLTVFARIDHAAGAAKVGKALLPTQLLIFGNPAMGTELMTSKRTSAIDLPIKVLIWEEPDGKVWIAYNAPQYLAERHDIRNRGATLEQMRNAVKALVSAAASP